MLQKLRFVPIPTAASFVGAVLLCGTALAQGSDDCALAQPITGTGTFVFDNTVATTDGLPDALCDMFGSSQIDNDVWFAWTAAEDCNYTIDTCGLTLVDTKIAIYDGVDCSTATVIDCNDDTCGLQSEVSAPALQAGATYLIRLGTSPGAAGGAGAITIASGQCAQPPIAFDGLMHSALGQATLTVLGSELSVSNIGSSGLDGVRIELGESGGWLADSPLAFDPAQLPVGASIVKTTVGRLNGVDDQVVSRFTTRSTGAIVEFVPDFSPVGSNTFSVAIYDGGNHITQVTGQSGVAVRTATVGTGNDAWSRQCRGGHKTCFGFASSVNLEIPGVGIFVGDFFQLEPEAATEHLDWISAIEMTANDVPELRFENEHVNLFGYYNGAQGQALLEAVAGTLRVSNLGSSGRDGVAIDIGEIGPNDGFDVHHDPLVCQPGEGFVVSSTGSFGGATGTELGFASFFNNAGQVQASADYSSIGSTDVRVQVFDGGSLVGEAVVPGGGVVADLNPGPAGTPSFVSIGNFMSHPWGNFVVRGDRDWSVSPSGGQGPFLGDELRLVAEPTSPIIDLETMALQFTSLGPVTILDEIVIPHSVGPESCFGDGGDQMGCTDCPCGNNAPLGSGGGCLNSVSTSAVLHVSGVASASADTLHFDLTGAVPGFALLFSGGDQLPNNAANPCFGLNSGVQSVVFDGLRCVGNGVIRHSTRAINANGDTNNGWGPPAAPSNGLIDDDGLLPGQTRHFQCVYREMPTVVCMTGQNTSQAISVTIVP